MTSNADCKRSMDWNRLICGKRLGLEHYTDNRETIRSDFQRDYDRLIFSSPFRRLQNKTQVFPLPGSIFVHNRLTHSLEVSSVGKSLASEVARKLREKYAHEPWVKKFHNIEEIVAAACLAHDLGNPPFGHSGEKSIGAFFSEGDGLKFKEHLTAQQWDDLIHFEGNANSFRLLVHQFKGRRPGGFAMTYSMLASIVKYPFSSSKCGQKGKFGFFTTERDIFERVANEVGLIKIEEERYCRHPLVYLMEAADDICYQIMDIEDAHKLKILTTETVKGLFLDFFDEKRQQHILDVLKVVTDLNEQIVYLRSCVIGTLIDECSALFCREEQALLEGRFTGALVDHISDRPCQAYRNCAATAMEKIYKSSDVLDIELAGNRIISVLLDKFLDAVRFPDKAYSRLLLNKVPEQYEMHAPTLYGKVQAVIDYISGMTDVYALDLYRKINGMSLPSL